MLATLHNLKKLILFHILLEYHALSSANINAFKFPVIILKDFLENIVTIKYEETCLVLNS